MTSAPTTRQLVLPGQAAAPDGPIDLAPMYLMHRGFRRDLDAFAAVLPVLPVGGRRRWRRLARRFGLFRAVLHKHHTGEDSGLWPLLRERGADPAVLDAMEAEHALIDPLLDGCSRALDELAGGQAGEAARGPLLERMAGLRSALSDHLGHEEIEGMALVQQHLTPADWERLDRDHFAAQYGPRDVVPTLGWVAAELPPDALRRLPGANAVLIGAGRLLGRWRAASDARTFAVPGRRRDDVLTSVSRRVAAAHTTVLRRTGGRVGARFRGGDVLLLTHRGRRSGEDRTTPLLYVRDGADLVVAASNGGIDREPQWWLNLQAAPEAEVEVGGRRRPVSAERVGDDDRARLWAALSARCDVYDGYQATVSRQIALVRLRPRSPAA